MRDDFFDKRILEKADGHESPVPADAWANITQKKKKRRYFFWWISGILLLTGLGIAGLYHSKNTMHYPVAGVEKTDQLSAQKNISNNIPTEEKNTNGNAETKIDTGSLITKRIGEENLSNKVEKDTHDGSIKQIKTSSQGDNKFSAVSTSHGKTGVRSSLQKNNQLNKDYTSAVFDPTDIYSSKNKNRSKNAGKSTINIKNGDTDDLVKENDIDQPGMSSPVAKNDYTSPENNPFTTNSQDYLKKMADSSSSVSAKLSLTDTVKHIVSTEKKPKKNAAKKQLFIDASATAFIGIHNKDQLISIQRITVTPIRKTEFTATDIRTSIRSSFGYQLALRKIITPKISIATGLQYSFIKEEVRLSGIENTTLYNVVKRLNENNGSPFLYNDTLAVSSSGRRIINATNSYQFISIPLLLNYELATKNDWSLSIIGGTYLNISSKYKNSIAGPLQPVYQNGNNNTGSEQKFTADIFAGARFARRFGSRYQIFAEPGIRYSVVKYDMQNIINRKYIHRVGLSAGLSFKLGK